MRQNLFRYRSYTPIPFVVVMLLFAQPTTVSLLIGGGLALAGEFIRSWGVAYAGSLTRVTGGVGAPEVIVAGPFAHVRNPLYLGNVIMYIGIAIMSHALFPWLTLFAFIFFVFQYTMIISLEEDFLEKEFGAGYLEFKKNVPRFIPRLLPYESPAQATQLPRWLEAMKSELRTLQAFGLVTIVLLVLWYRG